RERLGLPSGRHAPAVLVGGNPPPGDRAVQVARRDHVQAVAKGEGLVLEIEAQLPLARRFVGSVALEAVLRQDRAHLPHVTDDPALRPRRTVRIFSSERVAPLREAPDNCQDRGRQRAGAPEPLGEDERLHCQTSLGRLYSPTNSVRPTTNRLPRTLSTWVQT